MLYKFSCMCYFVRIRRPPRSTRTTHSFPTRRSSDLGLLPRDVRTRCGNCSRTSSIPSTSFSIAITFTTASRRPSTCKVRRKVCKRSEEHTSELQSLKRISYAIFCLNKKHTKHLINHTNTTYLRCSATYFNPLI